MKKIEVFFDKFKSSAVREIQKRLIISEIIKKETNIDISIEKISINNGKIKTKVSSLEKNQIYIKKQNIINLISKKIKDLKISSIE